MERNSYNIVKAQRDTEEVFSPESTKSRNTFLDIVKYFTIFLVIWGHVVQQTYLAINPFKDYIYQAIYTMHMPLFMGLCGYFYAQSVNGIGVQEYIKEKLVFRLKTLLIPMIIMGGGEIYTK